MYKGDLKASDEVYGLCDRKRRSGKKNHRQSPTGIRLIRSRLSLGGLEQDEHDKQKYVYYVSAHSKRNVKMKLNETESTET